MTDEELSVSDATLIARLRELASFERGVGVMQDFYCGDEMVAAADRIEELIGKNNNLFDLAEKEHSRAERLEAALREAAHAWATFKGATISDEHFHAVKRLDAALKGDDHE